MTASTLTDTTSERGASIRRALLGPAGFLALTVTLLFVVPRIVSGTAIGQFDVFNGLQTFASLGLVAVALGLTMIIGEFDLSVVGSYGLGGLVGVQVGQSSPVAGLIAGLAVGLVAGVVQGLIVSKLGLSSVPVTLGGLLVMLGLTYQLSGGENVPFDRIDFGLSLDETILGIFSMRTVITIVLCVGVAVVLRMTAAGRLVRAVGGDRQAAASIGLPVGRVIVTVFGASGALSALAGAMSAFALASAQASIGFQPLTFAVTAALIGGVVLSGGRGTVLGIAAAAVGLSMVQGIFQVLALQVYYSDVIMGVLLAVVAAVQAPGLRRILQAQHAARTPLSTSGGN